VKLLLDTHIWLWSHLEPERIGRRLARTLLAPGNQLWLSPISVWECLLLAEKNRIVLDRDARDWVAKALAQAPMHQAPLTYEVALASRTIDLSHEDPADRFLAATAAVYDLVLTTADRRLLEGRGYQTLSNR
jgi:PIN domain nuclease of toxin-antitoxin system